MKSITIKKLYHLHSWVGLITGVLLFIIAFSGAVAVFAKPELVIWANDEIRAPITLNPQAYEDLVNEYAVKVGPAYQEEVHIRLPSARTTEYSRLIFEGHFETPEGKEKHEGIVYQFDPRNLQQINESEMDSFFDNIKLDMSTFLAHFHADLHLGRPVGLILTGLLGLTLMVSIVTGLFIHRKILGQLFTFRIRKTFSLMLTDGHKVMSVWAVLFHSTIAFTGAFLGLATVLLIPAAAYVGFNGDQDKLLETFTAIKAPVISHIEQPTQLATIIEHSIKSRPDLEFIDIAIMGYADKNALVYIRGIGGEQLGGETLIYNGATAEYIKSEARFGRLEGVTGKILDAMFPLHYGNFGGVFVKIIWSILGMMTALLPITGLMLWIERGLTAQQPNHSKRTYHNFNRLLIGACGGIVLATVSLFPAQLILNRLMTGLDHTSAIFIIFFGVWIVSFIAPFILNYSRVFRAITLTTAVILMAIMPLDAILTGSHLFNVIDTQHYVSITINCVLFVFGVLIILAYRKVSNVQKDNHITLEQTSSQETDNDLLTKKEV